MRFFTLHERPGNGGEADLLAVPSGFSWWAALFPLFWLLWHRLWLGLALYVAFGLLLGLALDFGGIAEPAGTALGIAVSFLIGCMAADFRRWTYARRGWRMLAVVLAGSAAEAEARYLRTRHVSGGAGSAGAVMPTAHGPTAFPRLV
ncbi:MAG TPA: DUF2628 domain-containing protein [Ferrovibrio sp.]|jgi:hypothetical protein|uniref:DUF2628 domain-containing protein n=1 Tax=Ferrovibrio sp. TaxID=1917215 RepID=UPI002ED4C4B4